MDSGKFGTLCQQIFTLPESTPDECVRQHPSTISHSDEINEFVNADVTSCQKRHLRLWTDAKPNEPKVTDI